MTLYVKKISIWPKQSAGLVKKEYAIKSVFVREQVLAFQKGIVGELGIGHLQRSVLGTIRNLLHQNREVGKLDTFGMRRQASKVCSNDDPRLTFDHST